MTSGPENALTTAVERVPAEQTAGGFLTVSEAATLLSVCERTVYDALRVGRLRGRKIGRLWRTKREWLDDFGLPNRR
jgi:excisionase family DNA binding protein